LLSMKRSIKRAVEEDCAYSMVLVDSCRDFTRLLSSNLYQEMFLHQRLDQ